VEVGLVSLVVLALRVYLYISLNVHEFVFKIWSLLKWLLLSGVTPKKLVNVPIVVALGVFLRLVVEGSCVLVEVRVVLHLLGQLRGRSGGSNLLAGLVELVLVQLRSCSGVLLEEVGVVLLERLLL